MARVSDFFSKESKSDFFEGVKVREDWLVQVNLLYNESKYFFYFIYLFFLRGGGGG